MSFQPTMAYARSLDRVDELAYLRGRFVQVDPDLIYLDGNSLGRLPGETAVSLQNLVANTWGQQLIKGWQQGWMTLQERIGAKLAPLVGAQPDELIIADSTSVNLFKLALAAVMARPERNKIVTDDLNFPSDIYILQGVAQLAQQSLRVQVIPSEDGIHGPVAALEAAIDADTALVTLSHTVFKSGYTYDMEKVTAVAHKAGAMMLWDMSHSVGSVPGTLNQANADLAVGCTYKYLNGGPGAPAFLYVRRDLQDKLANPISGWMGQNNMFEFGLEYEPAPGIRRFLTGTPPILSIAAIEPGVDLLLEAGIERLRAKSLKQTAYLLDLWQEFLQPLGFRLQSPLDGAQRGSHIALGHDAGWQIAQALINEMNVLPDFRKPDLIRLGIAPLYTSFEDLFTAVSRLRELIISEKYMAYGDETAVVT